MSIVARIIDPPTRPRKGAANDTHSKKYAVTVRIEPDGREVRLEGREGWAMRQLVHAGAGGCTPITHPGPRWSDYVFILRGRGFVIEMIHEAHGGPFAGSHVRYVLHTRVTIIEDTKIAA